jgi:hypothetical protein
LGHQSKRLDVEGFARHGCRLRPAPERLSRAEPLDDDMPEVAFSCMVCSRMFLAAGDYAGGQVPRHLDPLLGTPCVGSQEVVLAFLDTRHADADWPVYRPHA